MTNATPNTTPSAADSTAKLSGLTADIKNRTDALKAGFDDFAKRADAFREKAPDAATVQQFAKRAAITTGIALFILYAAYLLIVIAFYSVFAIVGGYVGFYAGRYQRVRIARAGGFGVVIGTFLYNATELAIALIQDIRPATKSARASFGQKADAVRFYFDS